MYIIIINDADRQPKKYLSIGGIDTLIRANGVLKAPSAKTFTSREAAAEYSRNLGPCDFDVYEYAADGTF